MKTIQSFTVDHTKLRPGLYISRKDGDVTTFDLRTRTPNAGDYMSNLVMHSVEHLFATAVRNGPLGEGVLYFGPMGCQTGFYLLTRGLAPEAVRDEILRVLEEICAWTEEMPGGREIECGNYRNLDLAAAKEECARYLAILKEREIDFEYEV
ncbi:MAG: S-ribosylhomocysteine lyase [Ruminococcaceae bacterium]|nr:S-ribosylhomocysteine lyase [Oscillospiraceae bacterium]